MTVNKEWGVDIPTRINQTDTIEELKDLLMWCGDSLDGYDLLCALEQAFDFGTQEGK